jgi:hypothetical protein
MARRSFYLDTQFSSDASAVTTLYYSDLEPRRSLLATNISVDLPPFGVEQFWRYHHALLLSVDLHFLCSYLFLSSCFRCDDDTHFTNTTFHLSIG